MGLLDQVIGGLTGMASPFDCSVANVAECVPGSGTMPTARRWPFTWAGVPASASLNFLENDTGGYAPVQSVSGTGGLNVRN